jgi:ABC-type uncharacterized transport system substrate-binding protein
MITRREFITLLGGAAAWPLAARAQQPAGTRRIGVLVSFVERDPDAESYVKAIVDQLQDLGWTEGRNIHFDYRWDAAERNRARALAKELVDLQPDLVVACAAPAAVALWEATHSIPIVFAQVTDPVALGMAASLAAPGGNANWLHSF